MNERVYCIEEIKMKIEPLAEKYPIKQIFLFGSYANGRATAESDIDLAVEFAAKPVSLLESLGFQDEAAEILEKSVDLVQYPLLAEEREWLKLENMVCIFYKP